MATARRATHRPGPTRHHGRVRTFLAAPSTQGGLCAFAASAELPPPELPPELPLPELPPPQQQEDWVELEAAVARFDGQEYLVVPRLPLLQQPEVIPLPQHNPAGFAAPQPMPAVDWAVIAGALFEIVERENCQRARDNN